VIAEMRWRANGSAQKICPHLRPRPPSRVPHRRPRRRGGPRSYIAQALDTLHAERIDHGVRCLEDPAVVSRLARDRVPLTVCPLSNVRLGVVDDIAHHPLPELIAHGLFVTLNSDDAAYFGGYLNENYTAVAESLGLSRQTLCTLARNAFKASFLHAAARAEFIAKVDAYCGAVV
jgi:adenosine deaminase